MIPLRRFHISGWFCWGVTVKTIILPIHPDWFSYIFEWAAKVASNRIISWCQKCIVHFYAFLVPTWIIHFNFLLRIENFFVLRHFRHISWRISIFDDISTRVHNALSALLLVVLMQGHAHILLDWLACVWTIRINLLGIVRTSIDDFLVIKSFVP